MNPTEAALDPPPEPAPAATVVLLRPGRAGPEVLLTQRPATMAFAADMHVFPGGRIDPGDADPRLAARTPAGDDRARVAALRELFEEAGVLLADGRPDADGVAAARAALLAGRATIADVADDLELRLRPDLLAPVGHWMTPPTMPRRFDTRFFAAELPPGVEPAFAAGEVVAHAWLTPRAALAAMAAGEISMWLPTSTTLQQLEHVGSLAEVRERLAPGPVPPPRVEVEGPAVIRIVVGEAGAVPGQTVNAWLVGRRRVVVVDPGDASDAAADAILATAGGRGARIVAVALTHVDPDHAAGAAGLASRLAVPVFCGPGGGRPLPYEVRELADDAMLPAGDVPLRVVATPGVRPDHVAFAVGGTGDLLVGDLFGPQADRAVLGPTDEAARAASVARVRQLGAARLLPGHGPVVPGPAVGPVSAAATPPGSGAG